MAGSKVSPSIGYEQASSEDDLRQILALQEKNLPYRLSESIKRREGFLTVKHSLEQLRQLNNAFPHTVAKNDNKIVGYALSMPPSQRNLIKVLIPMFELLDDTPYGESDYIIMGQICIDEPYRKQGIFRGLYSHMLTFTKNRFDHIITEVDERNKRSLYAHLSVGFKVIKQHRSGGQDWALIVLHQEN